MLATHDPLAPATIEFPLSRRLRQAEELTARFAPLLAILLLLFFGLWARFESGRTRLQFDELLEISAASAPTNAEVISFLASGVDFNPPLSHFLIRGCTALFGDTEFTVRLPAMVGVAVLLICLYSLISRWFTRSYGIVAMLLFLCLPVRNYAIQARPYGLVLGFSGLALLLYLRAIQRGTRTLTLIGLALCSAALVGSHYYAILVIAVIVGAELVRAWNTKQPDWPVFASCIAPPTLVLWLLRDSIHQQRQQLTHYFARGNLFSFTHGYEIFALDPLVYCLAILLIALAAALCWQKYELLEPVPSEIKPQSSKLLLGVGFLLLPIAGAFITQFVTHAYVPRYFIPAVIGLVICFCYCARLFSRLVPGLAVLLILPFSVGFGKALVEAVSRPAEALPAIGALTAEQTPLIFDTPADYARVYHYFPSLRSNLWVIVEPAASLRYRGYDTDDRIMLALASHGRAQTISLSAAVRRWPDFRLIPRSADYVWALKCLLDAPSQIQVKQAFGNSNFIFDVTVQPGTIAKIDACAQPQR